MAFTGLFEVFLSNAFSSAVDWGVGKVLDVFTVCPSCKDRNTQKIGNIQKNDYYCKNCSSHYGQYTNASENTISQQSQIARAHLGQGCCSWDWTYKKNFFGVTTDSWLNIPYYIQVDGMRGKNVLFLIEIKDYNNERLIKSDKFLLTTPEVKSIREDFHWKFHDNNFKDKKTNTNLLIVDTQIVTPFKDVLLKDRRLIKPWK